MSLSKYLQSLLPSAETADLKTGLTNNAERIETTVIPSIDRCLPIFGPTYRFKDEIIQDIAASLAKELNATSLKLHHSTGLMEHMNAVFKNMLVTIPYVRKEIDNTFGRNFTNVGLTFSKGNIIQFCEVVDFVVNYVRVFVNYLTATELMHLEGKKVDPDLPKGDPEYLRANALVFVTAMGIMANSLDELKNAMRRIPDAIVDKDSEAEIRVTVGDSNLDPLGFAVLPFPISLIFHYRLNRAEKEAEELERTKAEARLVEYRILLIKQRIDGGQGDAAIEAELEIQADRLYKIRQRQSKLEEKYGV